MTVTWRTANRANWDERVAVHLAAPMCDQTALRGGSDRPWLPLSYSFRARRSLATSNTPDARIVPAPIQTGKVGMSPKIR